MNKLIFSFEQYKAIYFRVPKVASTSLLINFRKFDKVEKIEDEKYDSSLFKFAFVRNPFDRLVSCYKHLIQRESVGSVYQNEGVRKGMPFEEFVDVISDIPVEEMDKHFRPQWTFIPEMPDFLGKFENLESNYREICQKIGVKSIPDMIHKNFTYKSDYREYYNDITIQKVISIYDRDFEEFGYKKDL